MIVSNSTPLICLTKLNRLHLLKEFFVEVCIPEEVYREVVTRGKEEKYPDALLVEEAVKEGWVIVKKATEMKRLEEYGIDKGEVEAISLALNLKYSGILVDQSHARFVAEVMGLVPKGTIFVLLKALKNGVFSFDDYLKDMETLVKTGFRMSDDVYIEAVRLGKKLAEKKAP
ncbi:MAG TPA: DUF3368 domain-containing protein [Euryarchaeota archaeon]|nr:DUF3368 domain-containing protein [Euryarchaeota archaeon]